LKTLKSFLYIVVVLIVVKLAFGAIHIAEKVVAEPAYKPPITLATIDSTIIATGPATHTTAGDYCKSLGELAARVAEQRDIGVPKANMDAYADRMAKATSDKQLSPHDIVGVVYAVDEYTQANAEERARNYCRVVAVKQATEPTAHPAARPVALATLANIDSMPIHTGRATPTTVGEHCKFIGKLASMAAEQRDSATPQSHMDAFIDKMADATSDEKVGYHSVVAEVYASTGNTPATVGDWAWTSCKETAVEVANRNGGAL
jgi:hypothetical protein